MNNVLTSLENIEKWCQNYEIPKKSKDTIHYEDIKKVIDYVCDIMDNTMLKVYYVKLVLLEGHRRYVTPCEANIFQYIMSRYDSFYKIYSQRYRWCQNNFTRISKIISKGVNDIPEDILEDIEVVIEYMRSYENRVLSSVLPSYKSYSILRYIKPEVSIVRRRHESYPEELTGKYSEYDKSKVEDIVNRMYSLYNESDIVPVDKLEAAVSMWTNAVKTDNKGRFVHSSVFNKLMRLAKESKSNSYILLCSDEDGDVHFVNGTLPTDYKDELTVIYGKDQLEFILGYVLTNYPNYKFEAIELV